MKKMMDIFNSKNLKFITITLTIYAIVVTFLTNFKIDNYIKYFILPLLMMIFIYIFILEKIKVAKNTKAYLYLMPILLILLSYLFVKIDTSNIVLNVIAAPLLILILFITLVNEHYDLSRFFALHVFKLFPYKLFSNLEYFELLKGKEVTKKKSNGLSIFIGCVIGIPIALILILLLTGADKYFGSFIELILDTFKNLFNYKNIVNNLLTLSILFIVSFAIIINILRSRNIKNPEARLHKANISISSTILFIINFVFVLFLVSEISKLTVNFLHLPVEYTYAKYAREGFFQLLYVTLINIGIIIYFVYYTTSIKENKLIKTLILILVAFSILLIFNSYYRMLLYIGAYGFTILRLQVILFLFMELLIFLIILKKITRGIKHNDAFIFMIVILSTYIVNLYLCTQPFIDFINHLIK